MSLRHQFGGSRANRDRRDQAFALSVIARATAIYNEQEAKNTAIMLAANEIEVCPDCMGSGEVVRYVDDLHVTDAVCLECDGRGWIQ